MSQQSKAIGILIFTWGLGMGGLASANHHEPKFKVGDVIANPLCPHLETQSIQPLQSTAVTGGKSLWRLSCSAQTMSSNEYIFEAVRNPSGLHIVDVLSNKESDRFLYENNSATETGLIKNTLINQVPGTSPGDQIDVTFFLEQGTPGCSGSILKYRWVKYNPLQDVPPVRSAIQATGVCLANLKTSAAPRSEPIMILDREDGGFVTTVLGFASVDANDELFVIHFDWTTMKVKRVLPGKGLLPQACGMGLSAAQLIPGQDRAVLLLGSHVIKVAGFEPGGASARTLYDGRVPGAPSICGRGLPQPSKFADTFVLDSHRSVVQYFHASNKLGGRHILVERAY